jgi:hypothetical protein
MSKFVCSVAVMTVGIHFEHTIGVLIIVPIALIHSEHVLHSSQKYQDWQLDDFDNKQDMQEAMAIK